MKLKDFLLQKFSSSHRRGVRFEKHNFEVALQISQQLWDNALWCTNLNSDHICLA